MGSWDCYCAICGGPFCTSHVAEAPRSDRFLRHHRLGQYASSNSTQSHRSTKDGHGDAKAGTDDYEVTDAAYSQAVTEDDDEEDGSFDPEIISKDMTAWMEDLYVLSRRTDIQTGEKVGYVSGVGRYIDSARVNVEAGNDPNFDPEAKFICYDGCIPFHWCCFELLGTVLEADAGVEGLDKMRLYRTMTGAHMTFSSRLDISYGDPGPANEQWWSPEAGKEFVVVHPMASLATTTALIRDRCMKSNHVVRPADRLRRTNEDIFRKLPLELLTKICNQLTPQCLYDLAIASATVDAFLEDKQFWRRYLVTNTPWNFELLSLLDGEADSRASELQINLQRGDYKSLFKWVDQQSTPRLWMRGSLMSIANRRRIWHVCEQLEVVYSGRCANFEYTEEALREVESWKQRRLIRACLCNKYRRMLRILAILNQPCLHTVCS